MAKIDIQRFGGVAPATPPRYLQDTQAQEALNVVPWYGSLSSMLDTTDLQDLVNNFPVSIYKFGRDLPTSNLGQYWFEFPKDVDVVQGFISGDTNERTYFTYNDESTYPRQTDFLKAINAGSGAYPRTSVRLGVPKAPQPSQLYVNGTIPGKDFDAEADPETRVYIVTKLNEYGEEGPPCDPITLEVIPNQRVTIVWTASQESSPGVIHGGWRVYRTATGTNSTEYLFVGEVLEPGAPGFIHDDVPPDLLGEPCPSIDWFPPPEDLKGIVGLPGGVLAGFLNQEVWLSEPFRAFAWPLDYQQTVGYKIVGLGTIDTTLVVLTQGRPFFIQGSDPANMIMVEADLDQACVSKRSIVSMGNVVVYASPDGLVAASPSGSRILTEQLFNKQQWQALNPASIHGYQFENRYYGFYDAGGDNKGGFVFDLRSNTFIYHDIYVIAGFSDIETDTLFVVRENGNLHTWETGSPKVYTWKSKKFTMNSNIAMTCFRVSAEAYPVDVRITRTNKAGSVEYYTTVYDDEIQRLPSGLYKTYEVELQSIQEVYQFVMGQSPSEISDGQ